MDRAVPLGVVCAALAATSALASSPDGCAAPPDLPPGEIHNLGSTGPAAEYTTAAIDYVGTRVQRDDLGQEWCVEFYRNRAYACGWSDGFDEQYQTFVLAYERWQDLAVDSVMRPLWVRLHGGAAGHFRQAGPDYPHAPARAGSYSPPSYFCDPDYYDLHVSSSPHPDYPPECLDRDGLPRLEPGSLEEENPVALFASLRTRQGLVDRVVSASSDPDTPDVRFRFLMVSMCDHDLYSGVALDPFTEPDPGNPYPLLGTDPPLPRVVDGLLATRAALHYARERLATGHVLLHGTSAGAVGAMSLAYALGLDSERVSGAILDSGLLHRWFGKVANTGCTSNHDAVGWDPHPFVTRIAPMTDFEHLPENAVRPDVGPTRVLTPLFDLWSSGDATCCGSLELPYEAVAERDDGTADAPPDRRGCHVMHDQLDAVLPDHEPLGPGSAGSSMAWEVCVDDDDVPDLPPECDRHSPTLVDGVDSRRDGPEADYNQVVWEWVKQRLRDPLP